MVSVHAKRLLTTRADTDVRFGRTSAVPTTNCSWTFARASRSPEDEEIGCAREFRSHFQMVFHYKGQTERFLRAQVHCMHQKKSIRTGAITNKFLRTPIMEHVRSN